MEKVKVWYLRLEVPERKRMRLDEATLRRICRRISRIGDLALFAVTPRAIHLVVVGSLQRVGRVSAAIALSVRPCISAGLTPTFRQRLESRGHLLRYVERLLVEYLEEEGVEMHPALWSGSCFPELIGARVLHGPGLRLGAVVPQYRVRSAFESVGLPRRSALEPLEPAWIRAAGAARVVSAVAAAAAVGPPRAPHNETNEPAFPDHTGPSIAARRAVVTLARIARIGWPEVAWALGTSERGARRIATRPADWPLVRAAAVRLALEDELRRATLRAPRHRVVCAG